MLSFFLSYFKFTIIRKWHRIFGYRSKLDAANDLIRMRMVLLQGVVHCSNQIKAIDNETSDTAFNWGGKGL